MKKIGVLALQGNISEHIAAIDRAASKAKVHVVHGVYLATAGPAYETPAEIRAFATLGADAVGMSTVPEALLAHAGGLCVAAVACITNAAAGRNGAALAHEEVMAVTRLCRPRMQSILTAFFERLATKPDAMP